MSVCILRDSIRLCAHRSSLCTMSFDDDIEAFWNELDRLERQSNAAVRGAVAKNTVQELRTQLQLQSSNYSVSLQGVKAQLQNLSGKWTNTFTQLRDENRRIGNENRRLREELRAAIQQGTVETRNEKEKATDRRKIVNLESRVEAHRIERMRWANERRELSAEKTGLDERLKACEKALAEARKENLAMQRANYLDSATRGARMAAQNRVLRSIVTNLYTHLSDNMNDENLQKTMFERILDKMRLIARDASGEYPDLPDLSAIRLNGQVPEELRAFFNATRGGSVEGETEAAKNARAFLRAYENDRMQVFTSGMGDDAGQRLRYDVAYAYIHVALYELFISSRTVDIDALPSSVPPAAQDKLRNALLAADLSADSSKWMGDIGNAAAAYTAEVQARISQFLAFHFRGVFQSFANRMQRVSETAFGLNGRVIREVTESLRGLDLSANAGDRVNTELLNAIRTISEEALRMDPGPARDDLSKQAVLQVPKELFTNFAAEVGEIDVNQFLVNNVPFPQSLVNGMTIVLTTFRNEIREITTQYNEAFKTAANARSGVYQEFSALSRAITQVSRRVAPAGAAGRSVASAPRGLFAAGPVGDAHGDPFVLRSFLRFFTKVAGDVPMPVDRLVQKDALAGMRDMRRDRSAAGLRGRPMDEIDADISAHRATRPDPGADADGARIQLQRWKIRLSELLREREGVEQENYTRDLERRTENWVRDPRSFSMDDMCSLLTELGVAGLQNAVAYLRTIPHFEDALVVTLVTSETVSPRFASLVGKLVARALSQQSGVPASAVSASSSLRDLEEVKRVLVKRIDRSRRTSAEWAADPEKTDLFTMAGGRGGGAKRGRGEFDAIWA